MVFCFFHDGAFGGIDDHSSFHPERVFIDGFDLIPEMSLALGALDQEHMHHEERMVFESQAYGVVDFEGRVRVIIWSKEEEIGVSLKLFMLSICLKFSKVIGVICHEFCDLVLTEQNGFALLAPEHGPGGGANLKAVKHEAEGFSQKISQ